jgi:hypothetical protein
MQAIESVAPSFAVKPMSMLIPDPAAIAPTIAAFAQEPNGGLVVTSDVFMIAHRHAIIEAAARHRLPAIYQDRSFVADGGLMSYSVDRREQYRRVATYVDRILKGAKPGDLPVQVLRDNLDENGSSDPNVKRRPVATPMILSRFAVRKRVFALMRCATTRLGPWRAEDRAVCRVGLNSDCD